MNTNKRINLQLFAGGGMKNLDMQDAMMKKLGDSIKNGNEDDFVQYFSEFADDLQQSIVKKAKKSIQSTDTNVLSHRGTRQLTSDENKYYQKVIEAMKSGNPKQSLEDLSVTMPKTIIDDVFEDLITDHPLLDAIDFQNSGAVTEWLLNANTTQLATWSPLCAEIIEELTSEFKKIDLEQNKLSAFIPIDKAMLDLGPVWLDKYIRTILSEALYLGLEDGILNGKGQTSEINEPIGMRKDLSGSVVQSKGYPDKNIVKMNSLDPKTYGEILVGLSKAENGNSRVVSNVILVVNPSDYLTKIYPATTPRSEDGVYTPNVFPFPTTVIQSTRLKEGEAIMGIGKRYFMASGSGNKGIIEHSDHYRFLEDERVYLTKFYGHGQPKDNNSFVLLDISELEPTTHEVTIKGEVRTKAEA